MLLTRRCCRICCASRERRSIFVGSALGRIGLPGFSVYSASKFGLRGFAEALRRELGRHRRARPVPWPAQHAHRLQRRRRSRPTTAPPAPRWTRPSVVAQALLRLLESERAGALHRLSRTLAVRLNGLLAPAARRRLRQAPAPACADRLTPTRPREDRPNMNKLTFTAPAGRRRCLTLLCSAPRPCARPVDDAVAELQHDWEVIRYQTPAGEREKRFEALAAKAHQAQREPSRPREPLIWEGIIVSSLAGEKGGLGALGLVEAGQGAVRAGDPDRRHALDGSAYNSLGVLYYKVPRLAGRLRRQGQGAASCCRRRWRSTRRASTRTSSTASTWSRPEQRDEAIAYLERALQAPARPGPPDRRRRPARGDPRRCSKGQAQSAGRLAASAAQLDEPHCRCRRRACRSAARGRAARRCAARSTRPARCRFSAWPSGR